MGTKFEDMTLEEKIAHNRAGMDRAGIRSASINCPHRIIKDEPGASVAVANAADEEPLPLPTMAANGGQIITPPGVPPILTTHDGGGETPLLMPTMNGHAEPEPVVNAGDDVLPLPSWEGKPVLSGYGSVRRPAVQPKPVSNVPAETDDDVLGLPQFGLCPEGE